MTPTGLPRLVVFGEALTDLVRTGEDSWRSIAGGACWNVARVAATLGGETGWGGAVSDDLFGARLAELSREAGLDPRFLQVVPRPPLLAVVHQIDPPRYFFLGENAADLAFDEAALPAGWEAACQFVHFGCISLVRQPLGERLVALALRLADAGVPVSFDPHGRTRMGGDSPPLFERLAARAAVLKISDEDLRHIYPALEADAALERVRALAPAAVLLYTRGGAGMDAYAGGERFTQPAFAVEVVDTVGAGDACIGGFLASRLLRPDAPLSEHARFAAATAAAACTRAGAHAPTRQEVEALLARG
ncbi:carbohydrate kinase family protein [Pseudoxanthomonas suwonensis]|uniref:carbohydrate kinase family protein n=1 Tax=Pseudoxanthomonas suwonensis TaxID=314722 RepID=UPI00138F58EB|nr:carbohydrate kinase [Pseudoxanthomonas suwonensis]KAF1699985.1 carbohydrate kinase [Pseudoxanthomonas suwonensis]